MQKKRYIILEIIILLVAMLLSVCLKFYPEYQKTKGSSDNFINIKNYECVVEVKLNTLPNFALVLNKKQQVEAILFYNEESLLLYNQNIEGKSIDQAIEELVSILFKNNAPEKNSLTLIEYGEEKTEIKQELTKAFQKRAISVIWQQQSSLDMKVKQLNIETTEEEESALLQLLEEYSKELIRHKKNHTINTQTNIKNDQITKAEAKMYANNIYKKIENYALDNKIENQEVTNSTLPIQSIPAEKNASYYPNSKSWYYIKEYKVYAYIELDIADTTYGYCYQASIDNNKEGEC